jgi:hypothetical protein
MFWEKMGIYLVWMRLLVCVYIANEGVVVVVGVFKARLGASV